MEMLVDPKGFRNTIGLDPQMGFNIHSKRRIGKHSRSFQHPLKYQLDLREPPSTDIDTHEESPIQNSTMGPQLMGKLQITAWKASSGRAKSWKPFSYTKAPTKRQKSGHCKSTGKKHLGYSQAAVYVTRCLLSPGDMVNPIIPAVALKSQKALLPRRFTSKPAYTNSLELFTKQSKNAKRQKNSFLNDPISEIQAEITGETQRKYVASPTST